LTFGPAAALRFLFQGRKAQRLGETRGMPSGISQAKEHFQGKKKEPMISPGNTFGIIPKKGKKMAKGEKK